jgi:hypothetical protein
MGYHDPDKPNTYAHGPIPAGANGTENYFLRRDGTWSEPNSAFSGTIQDSFINLQDTPINYVANAVLIAEYDVNFPHGIGPPPRTPTLKKITFGFGFTFRNRTLPAKVALEAPVTTHAPLGPLPRQLLRTSAAEKVVFEIHAQHSRQLRHTASPPALRLAPVAGPPRDCKF